MRVLFVVTAALLSAMAVTPSPLHADEPAAATAAVPADATAATATPSPTAPAESKGCACSDCKAGGGHGAGHGPSSGAAAPRASGPSNAVANLSDMAGDDSEFDCHPSDEMCRAVRDHPEKMPGWLRKVAGKSFGLAQIEPHTLIQTQWAAMVGKDASIDHGDRAERAGFALRRARFGASGTYGRRTEFGAYLDLAGGANLLSEAWVAFSARHTTATIGAYRTPFSRSSLVSSTRMAMVERPHAVVAMAPFRQVGVTLSGSYPELAGLAWFAGAYNGFERDKNFYNGFKEFSGLAGNRYAGLAYVIRLSAEPMGSLGAEVYDTKGGGLRVGLGGGYYRSSGSTTTLAGYNADLHLKLEGVHLLAEYLADSADPKETPTEPATINASVSRTALIGEVGYTLKRGTLALRYQKIDPDTARSDDQDEQIMSVALSYQTPKERARLQLQFDHRQETNGPALENDVVFAQLQLFL